MVSSVQSTNNGDYERSIGDHRCYIKPFSNFFFIVILKVIYIVGYRSLQSNLITECPRIPTVSGIRHAQACHYREFYIWRMMLISQSDTIVVSYHPRMSTYEMKKKVYIMGGKDKENGLCV